MPSTRLRDPTLHRPVGRTTPERDGAAGARIPAPGVTRVHDASALAYLPALDGVRAFAVLAVMAYHAGISSLSGGFLGVDTFFVLSGFLITTLLLREQLLTGSIRLGNFWARRARRLLPALLVVLLFVAGYAALIAPAGTYPTLRTDSLFTLFYTANWHFIFSGANYFNATGPPSPLTHTWSLAVEEQFYLVWPLVVLGLLTAFRRRPVRALRVLLAVSLLGALASAIEMGALWDGTNETRLYYGTDTHAQCLLAGAALAVLVILASRARARRLGLAERAVTAGAPWAATSIRSRRVLAGAGVGGVVVTALLWTNANGDQWWLYHGGFLLAAGATVAVLAASVLDPKGAVARLLALGPLRYLGRISYGMYLWHFPLFLWLDHARTGLTTWPLFGLRVGVTVVVASASFYVVERPIRERRYLGDRRALIFGPLAVASVAGLLFVAIPTVPSTAQLAASPSPSTPTSASPPGSPAASTVLFVGDSMSETLANGVGGAVGQHFGLNVVNGGDPNCSLAMGSFEVQDYPPNPGAPACNPSSGQAPWPVVWGHLVRRNRPDVSVFVARLDIVNRLFHGHWVHIGNAAYDAYLRRRMRLAVHVLTSEGGKVILLTSPYYDTGEQPDGAPWPEDNPARVRRYNAMLYQVARSDPHKVFVVDLNKIADPKGHFQEYIDGVEVRYTDGIHWTYQGDCWLAPRLLPLVAAVAHTGALPPSDQAARLVAEAERTFPTSLCHAPN